MSQESTKREQPADEAPVLQWVGAQHLMQGYCGRVVATNADPAETTSTPATAGALEVRPVAVVRTRPSQGRVVRVGPPRQQKESGAMAA